MRVYCEKDLLGMSVIDKSHGGSHFNRAVCMILVS